METFIVPEWVRRHNFSYDPADPGDARVERIRNGLAKFQVKDPEISIVIPAYNEEQDILNTLSSLSEIETSYRTELIIANNNSKDRTQELLDKCGVKTVFVADQGISYARQGGLEQAKGKFIVNADSDSIYPKKWVDEMVKPLQLLGVSCSYGTYSFIPSNGSSRMALGMYEIIAKSFFKFKKKNRECVNVMGFTFAFKREDGMKVGGFDHNLQRHITGRSEDGWMALQLQQCGKLYQVTSPEAKVWTSDRRLMMDGSLSKAFTKRAKKELTRLGIYVSPKHVAKPHTGSI